MMMQKKRPMQRLLALMLCAAMLISLFPGLQLGTQAAADDLVYEIADGKVTITGYQSGLSGALTIPATIEGCPVTAIGDRAFAWCESLTGVTIPESVTSIGKLAFADCYGLSSITIPDSVTSIGDSAFNGSGLTDVEIGSGVTSIGNFVFAYCSRLTNVKIPDGVTSIGSGAFSDCYALTDVTIPNSVTTINGDAFYSCESLARVTIPASVTGIGGTAFARCAALSNIYFAGNVPSFGSNTFYGVKNATLWYISGTSGWDSVTANTLTGGSGNLTLRETEHVDENADNTCDRCGSVLPEPVPEGLVYEIADGQVTITGCDTSLTGDLVIPAFIEGYPVTAIGDDAFYDCNYLTGVTIPKGVTRIGDWAFAFCYELTDLTIPDSVTEIGGYAIGWCESLTEVKLPDSIKRIGAYAFNACYRLNEITIPDGVTVIEDSTFSDCSGLTSVTIPGSVAFIENGAFAGCSGLTSIEFPSGVTSLGAYAFGYCLGLTSVTLSDTVTSIAEDTFENCLSLTAITVSGNNPCYSSDADGVLYSKDQTQLVMMPAGFSGTYTVPDTVTGIGAYAFSYCTGLTEITIPDGVTSIGANAFYYCTGLTEITIPHSVTNIGEWAFYYCDGLTSVVIPDSVTTMGGQAFYCCRNLSSVKLSNKLTDIGDSTFYYCSSLTSVTIPESVTSIGEDAFENCTALRNIYFVGDAPSFGATPFGYVKNATFWYISGTTGWDSVNVTKLTGNSTGTLRETEHVDEDSNGTCDNCGTSLGMPEQPVPEELQYTIIGEEVAITGCDTDFSGELVIPAVIEGYPVTSIQYGAFMHCTGMTGIVIPETVTLIGSCAFLNCSELTSVIIPDGVTIIGDYTFERCSSLTSVTIPDSVTAIGEWAFCNCSQLADITIPESVTFIGEGAFCRCSGLTDITIPEGVTSIGKQAFDLCTGLTNITIPSSVTDIGDSAFYGCTELTDATISDGVTSIGNSAFYNCTGLTNVTIPGSVTAIGDYAFCFTGLTTITFAGDVPTFGDAVFGEINATVWYPCNAQGWEHVIADSLAGGNGSISISMAEHIDQDADGVCEICGNPLVTVPEGLVYEIRNGEVIITGYDDDLPGELIIPAMIEGCPVTAIGDFAFNECALLNVVTLPDSITSIGDYAFSNCFSLANVTLSAGVTEMGDYAFAWCDQLTSVFIPDGVTCIGDSAFAYCYDLSNMTLPGSITEIGSGAFERCYNLMDVIIPNRVTIIENYTFAYCYSLMSVTIPEGVTSIGDSAFTSCYSLKSVMIPENVTNIGTEAFTGCTELTEILVSENNGFYCNDADGVLFTKDKTKLLQMPGGYVGAYTIPDGVTEIGPSAFCGCDGLTEVVIPEGVTVIGSKAFGDCTNLTNVSFPDTLLSIGEFAFRYCPGLTSVTIPDSVTTIGQYAFYWCNITDVTIGSGVTSIGNNAFYNCIKLKNITFNGNPPSFGSTPFYNVKNATLWYPCGATGWNSVTSSDLTGRYGTITLQAEDHSFTNYVSDGNATCTQEGTKTAKCDNCDATDTVTDVGSGGKHTLTFVPEVVSCTEPGNIAHYQCDGCGKLFADATALVELTAAEVLIAAKGHTEVTDPAVEPGCMTGGLTEGKHCCVCGTVLVPQSPVGSLGHSYDQWKVDVEPTCTQVGKKHQSCNRCGHTVYEPIEVLEHSYESQVVLPTYLEQGYTLHTCSGCGDSYKDTYVEALQRVELSHAELELEYTSAYYQGRPLTPGVTLTYEGETYDASKELKLTYANNDRVGTATVTVEGINKFQGTAQLTFEIAYEVIPKQIVNVFVVGEIGKISVSWGQSSEVNTDTYKIYRKAQDEAEYRLITTVYGREVLSYEDRNVEREKTYSYYVTGVGLYGAESEPSQVAMATVQVDKTAPTVLKITPAAASVISGNTQLSTVARDNVAVTKVAYFYSQDNGETWISMGETTNSSFSILFDTSKLEGASVKVKALAYDAEGNESEPRTVVYSLDNVGPEKVTGLAAVTLSSKITLSWKDVDANDAAYFVLQTKTEDGWKNVASNIKTLGYTVTGLKGDTEYTYRVACVDTHGNVGEYSDAFTARTAADVTAPVITHQSPNAARYNQSIGFSATAKDDCDIATIAIQVSKDLSSWTTLSTKTYTDRSFSQTYSYTIDLSEYDDGSLFVRAVATDFAGNVSNTGADAPYTEYFVDRTAPKAPTDVAAKGNDGYITVSWSMGSEADLGKYFVYRATSEDGEYQLIASNLSSLNYHDRDVTRDSQYYYKVAVSDGCGNRSQYSEAVFATMSQDTRKPEITGISTTYQQKISPSSHKIYVAATDNNQLSRIIVEYCTSVNPQYKLLAMEENIGTYSKSIPVELPIEGLTDGDVIYLRAYAVDVAGLRSDNQTMKYTLDLTAPQAAEYAAQVEGAAVTLSWKDQGEEDLSGFKVYRSVAGGSFKLLGSRGVNSTGSYTFVDTITAKESNVYVYKLEAMDRMGNTASWQKTVNYVYVETEEAPDEYVNQAPIPQMSIPGYMTLAVEEIFDASGSWDDIGIAEYLWDFGDGTYSTSMKPIKSYAVAGTYIVKLSVTDTEGCISTVTATVEVKPRDMLGMLNVKVVDENGKALSYVPVYFDLGSENQKIIYTNGLGEAGLQMPGGTHTVGMYAAGYLPVKKDVVVLANATRTVTLTTVEEDIVTGHFEITRMTFDEIVAAGIDVYDPANQNVYSATVRVTYGSSAPLTIDYVRNDHQILTYTVKDTEGKPVKEYKSGNGEVRKITGVTYIPQKTPNGTSVGPGGGSSQQADVVAIVDIPASASYLKEFFDVRLHIVNNASPEFVLENNEVVLNVPEGMTLMNSVTGGYRTSNTVEIPFIKGQQTVTLAWVLRGDLAGEYDLSADFTGTLAEFDEVVTATFETEEPIKVYGLEGVKFRILAADEVHNDTLYFNIELVNERDIDVYMPAIGLTDKIMNMTESVLNDNASGDFNVDAYLLNAYVQTGEGTKFYQPVTFDPNGRAETPVKVLAPGQKLVIEYVAYNAINYNGVAHFKDAAVVEFEGLLENIETGSFHKELYSFEDHSDKLEDILSGTNPDAAQAKDYIINDGNFYYAGEAEKISDTALKNLYKIASTVLEGDLSALTQDEERDLIQRVLLSVLSHESVTKLSEDFMMSKYNKAVTSMIEKVKIGTINSFVGDGITGENITEAFANIAKDSAELAAVYRDKGAAEFNKELSQRVAGAGLGITIDAGAMLALGGEAEAFSSVLDGGKDMIKSMFTAAQESEREALYFAVLKYNCNAEIAEIILDAVIKNTEDCLWDEVNAAIATGLLPMGAGILALRDVGLGEKTLIWQTAKDMKKTLESDRESFYGSVQDILNYVEDGAAAAASLGIKALTKAALGSTPMAIASAGFKIIDVGTGWGSYTKQEDAMEIYKACSDAFLGAYRDSIATRNEEADFYSMTYLRALTEIRLQGEQQYKAFVDDYLKGVHVAPLSEETVLKEINKQMNTNYTTVDEWWDAVQYNAVHARDTMFNLEYVDEIEIPRAPVVTLDYDRLQTVQSFSSAHEYCFADGVWKSCENAPISFQVGVTPSTLRVRLAATADTLAGEITTVKIYARKDLSKLINVRFDGTNYLIRNLSNAYYYQVLFTDIPEGPMDWSKAVKIAGSDETTVTGVGDYDYMIIRSCQNADRQETTSNPLTCSVQKKQKLNLEIQGRGSVFQTEKTGCYFSGDTIDLVAMPVADTVFRGWFIDGVRVSVDPHYLLEMTDELQIQAVFEGSGVRDVVIGNLPEKLEYRLGETLELDGLEVLVTYEDGTTVSTEHYTAALVRNAVGTTEVEISFGQKRAYYGVTILCGTPSENDPLGHTVVVDEAVDPTCTTTGLTVGKHCDVCGEILQAQEVIPVRAHSYENNVCIHCGGVDPAARITGLTCVGTTRTSIDLTWDALGMDAIYWIYVDGMVYGCTTGTTITLESRRPGQVYSVAVIAQLKDTFLSLTNAEAISVITEDYSFSSTAQAGVHSVTVNWEAKQGTRAWLLYGTSADALTVYTSSEDGTFTKGDLKANTTYYFQIAYLIGEESGLGTTFGEVVYGDVFQVTTRNDDRLNVTREGRQLTWSEVEGSTKYWVVVTIDDKTYTFTTLEPVYTIAFFTDEELARANIVVKGLNCNGVFDYNPVA